MLENGVCQGQRPKAKCVNASMPCRINLSKIKTDSDLREPDIAHGGEGVQKPHQQKPGARVVVVQTSERCKGLRSSKCQTCVRKEFESQGVCMFSGEFAKRKERDELLFSTQPLANQSCRDVHDFRTYQKSMGRVHTPKRVVCHA